VRPMPTTTTTPMFVDNIALAFRELRPYLEPGGGKCSYCVAELRLAARRFLANPFGGAAIPTAADLEAELLRMEEEYPGTPRAFPECHFAPHSAGTGDLHP
jgi:hypothetical protein